MEGKILHLGGMIPAQIHVSPVAERIGFLLRVGYEMHDEQAAWLCIMMLKELLRNYPAERISKIHPKAELGYLPKLAQLHQYLDHHAFCESCNELSDLVYLFNINRAELRDNILDLLDRHDSLAQDERARMNYEIFAESVERKQGVATKKP